MKMMTWNMLIDDSYLRKIEILIDYWLLYYIVVCKNSK